MAGHYVDRWVGTKTPWFTFIGLIAGVVAGFSLLIRMTKRKNDNKSNEAGDNADAK
ncbi:MAG: AtpZ/AtpI family protein [Candidatus Dadabacteria bacterium]|nr:AtpZ/AtpI family protein [Candidatus Dadabacteria bacterium]